MPMHICGAPCSWGVDDPKNPYLPPWKTVLAEAHQAGYRAIELGPWGYIPNDAAVLAEELEKNSLSIVAGTIFHDLVDPANQPSVLQAAEDICRLITDPRLPQLSRLEGQKWPAPYLTIMDWGHDERDYNAGHGDRSPRMTDTQWKEFVSHLKAVCECARDLGVRPVLHPHAGTYLEFEDEIARIAEDIPYDLAGFVLDTGHMRYSGMDVTGMLKKYQDRLDYVHFKDINGEVYAQVMGEHIRFFDGCGKGTMCPIGTGVLDYPAIQETLKEIGYSGYITIEQERDPRNAGTSLQDVKRSIQYLRSVGYTL